MEKIDLGPNGFVGTWTEERFLADMGKHDITLMHPFTLTMPDNHYWTVGEHTANAWSIGRTHEARERDVL